MKPAKLTYLPSILVVGPVYYKGSCSKSHINKKADSVLVISVRHTILFVISVRHTILFTATSKDKANILALRSFIVYGLNRYKKFFSQFYCEPLLNVYIVFQFYEKFNS